MRTRDQLLDSLASDLAPVRPAPNLVLLIGSWLLGSLAYVVLSTWILGPLRPGVAAQLLDHPRFLFEMSFGLVAISVLAIALFRSAIPGRLTRRMAILAIGLVSLWLFNYVAGLLSPALAPSMLGKRPHCLVETLIYAVPPMLAAIYWLHRLYPLRPLRSALLAGLAAGLLPAWYMQLACMYEPVHILSRHILPGLLVATLAPVLMWLIVRLRR